MGKFDKSRLKFQHNQTDSTSETTDLRLKLAKRNHQMLDARQILNKKKHQILTPNKKKIINEEDSFKSGSLMIMKTVDEDTGAEKRLYKIIDNYDEIEKKNHVVFANSKNTLITVNNHEQSKINRKNTTNEEKPFGLIKKTIINHDIEEEDLEFNNRKKLFLNREPDIQTITRRNPNENFKIKIINSRAVAAEEAMDVEENSKPPAGEVNSPIQGYRVLVSNLHPNVTEDDILELFSAIGPIKRAKLNKGTADVVFVKLEDARNAISSYNGKLLDGRELKIELLTKLPISEKLTVMKPIQQQQPVNNNYQLIKNQPQQPLFMKQQQQPQILTPPQASALPQRVRPIINFQNNEQPKQVTNPVSLSNRFANINATNSVSVIAQTSAVSSTPSSKSLPIAPAANSKVTVDTSIIHQALFTSSQSPKTNQNPVTFTVKI